MLNNSRLAVFFESEAQIRALIGRQKSAFVASLEMSREQMRDTYTRLGEQHYMLQIPYIDFIKGAEILQEQGVFR